MRPLLLAALLSFAVPVAWACGDGPDETSTPTPTVPASATPSAEQPTLAPPAARGPDDVALTVVSGSGSNVFQPTVAEFSELPTASGGEGGPEGVTLAELGTHVSAREGAVVTVEGRSKDLSAARFWRGNLTEAGTTLVVSIEDGGLARLAGSLIPEEAWIYAVETISYE